MKHEQREKERRQKEDDAYRRKHAATKIQAVQRGRRDRKRVRELREQERIRLGKEKRQRAANKKREASMKTGSANDARKNYEQRERERERKEDEAYKRKHAATKIQAVQRGRRDRRRVREMKEKERIRLGKEREGAQKSAQMIALSMKTLEERKPLQKYKRCNEGRRVERGRSVSEEKRGADAAENQAATKSKLFNVEGNVGIGLAEKGPTTRRVLRLREDSESNRVLPLKPYVTMDELNLYLIVGT